MDRPVATLTSIIIFMTLSIMKQKSLTMTKLKLDDSNVKYVSFFYTENKFFNPTWMWGKNNTRRSV